MLKNWLKFTLFFALLVTYGFSQLDSQSDSFCNSRPIINYNFGSSDIITDASNPSNAAQGKPGRIGPPGILGPKGQKGERGQPEDTLEKLMEMQLQLEELRRENDELRNQTVQLDNFTRALLRGYMELDDGWMTPLNGYEYKANLSLLTWDESRRNCQRWGGDLVVYGVRDVVVIEKLVRALGLPQHGHYFVGLSDRASEGNWRWLNGQPASTKDVNLWWPGHPRQGSSGATADCGGMHFSFDHPSRFRAWDQPCSSKYASLCEKLIV